MGNTPSLEAPEQPRRPQKLSKTRNMKFMSEDAFFDASSSLSAVSSPALASPTLQGHRCRSRQDYSAVASCTPHPTSEQGSRRKSASSPFVSSTYELADGSSKSPRAEPPPQQLLTVSSPTSPRQQSPLSGRTPPAHDHRYLLDPARAYGTQTINIDDSYTNEQDTGLHQQLHPPHRRRSTAKTPGVATRGHKASNQGKQLRNSVSMPLNMPISKHSEPHQQADAGRRPPSPPLPPLPPLPAAVERASTPCEMSYRQLGAIRFGTLRITNGSPEIPEDRTASKTTAIPSPVSAPLSCSTSTWEGESLLSPLALRMSSLDRPEKSKQPNPTTFSSRVEKIDSMEQKPDALHSPPLEHHDLASGALAPSQRHSTMRGNLFGSDTTQLCRSDSGFRSSTSDEGARRALSQSDSGYSSSFSLQSFKRSDHSDGCPDNLAGRRYNNSVDSAISVDGSNSNVRSLDASPKGKQVFSFQPRSKVLRSKKRASLQPTAVESTRRQSSAYFGPGPKSTPNWHSRSESDSAIRQTMATSHDDLSPVPAVPYDIERSLLSHVSRFQDANKGVSTRNTCSDHRTLPTIVSVDSLRSEQPGGYTGQAPDLSTAHKRGLQHCQPKDYKSQNTATRPLIPAGNESVHSIARKPVGSVSSARHIINEKRESVGSQVYSQQEIGNPGATVPTVLPRRNLLRRPSYPEPLNLERHGPPVAGPVLGSAPAFLHQEPLDLYTHARHAIEVRPATSMPDIRHRRKLRVPPPISLKNRNAKQSSEPIFQDKDTVHKSSGSHNTSDSWGGGKHQEGTTAAVPDDHNSAGLPLVYRNGHRRGSEISLGEDGPPFRILHSYYSPAYKNAPIWG